MQALKIADTKAMSRDEWLEERKNGIGGSDASSIMGVNPWASPLTVYMDKLGLSKPKETSEAMRQGTDLEQYVAERFVEETGKRLRRCNSILRHPEYEWMRANIDRDVVGEDAGFEAKTTSVYNRSDFENGEVPVNYLWQCQHYMAVTGAKRWYLGVLVLNTAFYVFCIERNDTMIELLIEREKDFWENNVLARVPPLPIGTDADDEAIAAMYPDGYEGDALYLGDIENLFDVLELHKTDVKALDKKISEIEQEIKMRLGDVATGETSRWRVSWKNQERTTVDTKRLREECPALVASYLKTSASRVLRVTKKKGA